MIKMLFLQIQFSNTTEEEKDIIPLFLEWVKDQMFSYINTFIVRKKIQLRINYIYDVDWINWNKKTKYIDVETIMNTLYSSFYIKQYKNNLWKIETDVDIRIPNTFTSFSKLLRFLNSGDLNVKGIGLTNMIHQNFSSKKLINLWQIYVHKELGKLTFAKIITD